MANMTFKTNLVPNTNLGYSLGSSTLKWNVYGDLTGNAATATKLATARTIGLDIAVSSTATSFDGSKNISIPVTSVKESYLSWGGKGISGDVSPIGGALSNEHSANRLAFLSGNAMYIEYSTNNGSTWAAQSEDSNVTAKSQFMTTSSSIKVGGTAPSLNNQTRITLYGRKDSSTNYFYCSPKKLLLNVNTFGHSFTVTIETKTGASSTWTAYNSGTAYALSGWSGWNDIPLILSTLGGSASQTSNIWAVRFTFKYTNINSSYTTTCAQLLSMRLYSMTNWVSASTYASTGHMYTFDMSKNVTFPATVNATTFNGNLTGNASTATKATNDSSGNNIVNTYLTKAAGVTAISWDSTNKKLTRTINGTSADVVQFATDTGISLTAAAGSLTIKNTGATGVKGNAESPYRTGNVNLTQANIIGSTAIGSATKPIYWSGSSFSAISSYEGNAATATKFASAQSIVLTGDTTGSASSQAGWSISTTTSKLSSEGRAASANISAGSEQYKGKLTTMLASSSMTTGKPSGDGYILNFGWDTDVGWGAQLALTHTTAPTLQIRGASGSSQVSTWGDWRTVLDSSNYTDYTTTKTGTGASGTWSINISGNASTATKLQTARKLAVNLANSSTNSTFDGSADQTSIKVSGVLPVANGGTGASSFTVNSVIMSNSDSTTGALTTRAVLNNTTVSALTSASTAIPTVNTVMNAGTNENTANTFVKRDSSGNFLAGTITANLNGNAATATILQTTRKINDTNFNGSADITTAKWGTARDISIANSDGTNAGAAVSVNGSGNVTLKLPATIKATLSGNATAASSYFIVGTQTAATNTWTGDLPSNVSDYYNGLSIDYFLPYAGTSTAATLNLGGKGAKPVYVGNGTSGVTTHYPANSVIHLTYVVSSSLNSGNGCWKVTAYQNNTYYVESVYVGTAAATAAKVGTVAKFQLNTGNNFQVLILNSNTSASALTLNINSTGAKPIYINGSASSSSNYTLPQGLYLVYYDGTKYYFSTSGYFYATKVYGAVWNDYAEYRSTAPEHNQPGRCVREVGDGTLIPTTKRLERGCEIVSDTFGFAIGETDECQTPIASNGRVLAYLFEDRELARERIGWPVCSGPQGTVSIMTEEEEEKYPSRIIGTISEVPNYEEWGSGNVKVNGRVWIRIK